MPLPTISTLPRARGALLVLAACALAGGAAFLFSRHEMPAAPVTAAEAAEAAASSASAALGSFKPTTEQWAAFTIEPVQSRPFDEVTTVDGNVAFDDDKTTSVYSQFSGRVTAIYAQPGQAVRKGSPLLAVLATEAAQTRSDLAAAVAAEATAHQQFELAQRTEHREHELVLAQAGAEKDWLQSQADLKAADNAWRAAVVALAAVREKAAVLEVGAPAAGGAMVISAPIAGVVVQRQVNPGQVVNSLAGGGSTALYTISDLSQVWVLGNVAEDEAAHIQVGQPVEIRALALGDRRLQARISWVASSVDPVTHRVTIRAAIANPGQILKPQMSVTLRVLAAHPAPALAVPRSALVYDGAQAHCYVVGGGHVLTARAVVVGHLQGNDAEILSGLARGDSVVTRGSLFIDAAAQGANP